MEIKEKFAALNKVVAETKMTEEEITTWFQSRQTSQAATTSSGRIRSIFPIAYRKDNRFEILSEFIPERKDEIWGYEIMPNTILAKKCGTFCWYNAKVLAEKCVLNGEQGHLPSVRVLYHSKSVGLRDKIKRMDKFLCENGIDAETEYVGDIWCSEVDYEDGDAYLFSLDRGQENWAPKLSCYTSDRLAVTF